jgi:poly(3-hydroxybutyrate) depolymerase
MSCGAQGDEFLPKLNLDLRETTVSGISSGAFMAVQMGVAHSAEIKGVAATAGGPYFCAGNAAWSGANVEKAIARCMQGDPSFPATPITDDDHNTMQEATDRWAAQGLIDATDNLARQKVWIFHGYNDGIVKRQVSDALQIYYRAFAPAGRIFYKHELPAAHAQISASCVTGKTASQCNACATTGGNFINSCAVGKTIYDAAGSALQFFYGPLTRAASSVLKGEIRTFSQSYYTLREGDEIVPGRISMAETGYLYVPMSCGQGEPCRLHIAFHGCQQYAEKIGMDFVKGAGLNEWAEKNHIVVLYPQATSTIIPFNPNGCWDWWGYNDTGDQIAGHYATQQGLQIAAVWRMAQFMAMRDDGDEGDEEEGDVVGVGASAAVVADGATDVGAAAPPVVVSRLKAAPIVKALDVSSDQIALVWRPVENAVAYRVYRLGKTPQEEETLISPEDFVDTAFVDSGLEASSAYRYKVVAVGGAGDERATNKATVVKTAPQEPACDPYFSMTLNHPVDRNNMPTNAVCKY